MEVTQSKVLDAGRRAQEFLDAYAAKVAAFVSALVRKQLDAGVAAIEGFKSQQNSSGNTATGETAAQATLRATIYEQFLKPIVAIAQLALPGVTDLGNLIVSFEMAVDGRRSDFETKVGDAITAAAKYQQTFIDHGMPDVVKQLGDALAQFKASFAAQGRHRGSRIAATTGLGAMEKSLRKTLFLLDSLLTPGLASDPDLLANWQASRKIHKAAVTPNPTGPAPEVAPAAPVSAPTLVPNTADKAAA
jgi:hypothetical protein